MRQQDRYVGDLLQSALYDRAFQAEEAEEGLVWEEILQELKSQSVALIPADKIKGLPLTQQQKMSYSYFAAQQIAYWNRLMFCQQEIVLALQKASIPVAVLKGAAAAMYYPKPMYRSMGDIDLIVGPGDFKRAFSILRESGCLQTADHKNHYKRHESLEKNGIHIELHRYFSTKREMEEYAYLDEQIYQGLPHVSWEKTEGYTFPVLPAGLNGLVLLQHISQHLETGLGLRQILDWMLYVRTELTDQVWKEQFSEEADRIGLRKLALITTRMCQMYLGLSEKITWCRDAEDRICQELMEYIMKQGNFGRKDVVSSRTVAILYHFRQPFSLLRLAQKNGCLNWTVLEKCPILRPFAWLYQLFRWAGKGVRRDKVFKGLAEDLKKAARQDVLLDDLGVRRGKKER